MELLIHKQEIKEEEDDLKSYSEEVAPEEAAEDDEQEGKKKDALQGERYSYNRTSEDNIF